MITSNTALTFKQQDHGVRRVPQCWFSAVRGLAVEARAVIRSCLGERTPCGHVIIAAIYNGGASAAWQPGSCPLCPVPFQRLLGVAARWEAGQGQTVALRAGDNRVHRNRCEDDWLAWIHWRMSMLYSSNQIYEWLLSQNTNTEY